jgi:hypothetical protein
MIRVGDIVAIDKSILINSRMFLAEVLVISDNCVRVLFVNTEIENAFHVSEITAIVGHMP